MNSFDAGGARMEVLGLNDDGPFLTLRSICNLCNYVVAERVYDVRLEADKPSDIYAAAGEADANAVLAHWRQAHPDELEPC